MTFPRDVAAMGFQPAYIRWFGYYPRGCTVYTRDITLQFLDDMVLCCDVVPGEYVICGQRGILMQDGVSHLLERSVYTAYLARMAVCLQRHSVVAPQKSREK